VELNRGEVKTQTTITLRWPLVDRFKKGKPASKPKKP